MTEISDSPILSKIKNFKEAYLLKIGGQGRNGGTYAATITVTNGRMSCQNAFGQQKFHTFATMSYGTFPVLGRFPTGNVLEFVGCDPGFLEPDARPFGALA